MPEHLDPSEQSALRLLSRSPHPYHRQNTELLDPSDNFAYRPPDRNPREVTPSSDSGTEADDEHFLKGLPAPRRLRKGLRGRNEVLSGTSTPIPSPALLEEEGRRLSYNLKKEVHMGQKSRSPAETLRRRKEIIRRLTELFVIGFVGAVVYTNTNVRPILRRWNQGTTLL